MNFLYKIYFLYDFSHKIKIIYFEIKMKLIIVILFLFLSTFSHAISLFNAKRTKTLAYLTVKHGSKQDDRVDLAKTVRACVIATQKSLPGGFCWKSPLDKGADPNCPDGYEVNAGLCYQKCEPGYKRDVITCSQICPPGTNDIGDWCTGGPNGNQQKLRHTDRKILNFLDDAVPCGSGLYKAGAFCYRNCENAGLFNCGIGACVSGRDTCLEQIAKMLFDFFIFVGQAVIEFMALGVSKATTQMASSVLEAVNKLGTAGLNTAFEKAKNNLNKEVTSDIQGFTNRVALMASQMLSVQNDTDSYKYVIQTCQNTIKSLNDKLATVITPQEVKSLDFIKIVNEQDSVCKVKFASETERQSCVKAAINVVGDIGSGVITMVQTFNKPFCQGV